MTFPVQLGLILALLAPVPVAVTPPAVRLEAPSRDNLETFDAFGRLVKRYFHDKQHGGVDWDEVCGQYRPLAAAAETETELHAVLGRALAELNASHAAILDPGVYRSLRRELEGKPVPTFGLLLEETRPGELFVRAFYEGGPADRAGLRRGDRIVHLDAADPLHSPHLVDGGYDPALPGPPLYFLRARPSLAIGVVIQSTPGGPLRRTTLVPETMSNLDAMENSVEVVVRGGRRIGLLHVWYCARGVEEVLREALRGPLENCDALVLDLRGRGGYSDVVDAILSCFQTRTGLLQRLRGQRREKLWDKPVAFLIDERSRSAKEILAYRIKREQVGTLVGRRTEGAVLGAGFFKLPDGFYLELPILSVPVYGVNLEGVGVTPHYEVEATLPYAAGRDAIFEKACEVLVHELAGRRARGHRLPMY